jgi:beta-lactamase class A
MQRHLVWQAIFAIAFVAGAICRMSGPAAAEAIPGPLAQLQQQLNLMSMRAPGHIGVIVKDLTTGLSTGINESANMPAASTIKIPVMVEVFRQMAAGDFDLDRAVTLESTDRDAGWGDLVFARLGGRYRVDHLLQLMITESDNTATNMLIRLVGRAHINATMQHLGLRQTRLADYIRSDGDIRSLRTSPRDMTILLDRMAHDQLVNAWSSRAMIAILTGQHHNGLLPEPLPPGTQIAHKTGTLHDTLNDVGIVYLNDSPYVIAVLTTHLSTLDSGRQFIRGVSRLAYDSLTKFATWREANPLSGLPAVASPAAANRTPDEQMWTPSSDDGPVAQPAEAGPTNQPDSALNPSTPPAADALPAVTASPAPAASP